MPLTARPSRPGTVATSLMAGEGPVLKTVVDAGVPALVIFATVVAGMKLTTSFQRIASWRETIAGWLLVCGLKCRSAIERALLILDGMGAPCPASGSPPLPRWWGLALGGGGAFPQCPR